jgi:hypothetical protein
MTNGRQREALRSTEREVREGGSLEVCVRMLLSLLHYYVCSSNAPLFLSVRANHSFVSHVPLCVALCRISNELERKL